MESRGLPGLLASMLAIEQEIESDLRMTREAYLAGPVVDAAEKAPYPPTRAPWKIGKAGRGLKL